MHRTAVAVLLACGVAALGVAALQPGPPRVYEDQRGYLVAASHLARSATLAYETPVAEAPVPDAFREPAYPWLVALAWRLAGAEAPASDEAVTSAARDPEVWGAVRGLTLALLAVAAVAGGLAARHLSGDVAGALAFALVAASPALRATATDAMSENLAAALFAVVAVSWALAVRRPTPARVTLAVAVTALAPLARAEAIALLPVAGLLAATAARRGGGAVRRWSAVAGLLLVLILPSLLWAARTRSASGHWALSDRGGMALAVRAELDAELVRHGPATLLLAWTPLESARAAAHERSPGHTLLDHRPVGAGSFFTRTLRRWQAERTAPGADRLGVDAEFRRRALERFAERPLAHLLAAPAVLWRSLFAERSPSWARPFDLTTATGLLLGAGWLLFLVRAAIARDPARLAFAAPLLAIALFHALATEFLPRYAVPLLPALWTALAVDVGDVVERRRRGARPGEPASAPVR
ncbi:MAG TPA: hypothetical protein VLA66_13825 [Thermoanaerobaculia bacterium]|nr:hypothetical protein [Thermoanaerobaculia bacterium]